MKKFLAHFLATSKSNPNLFMDSRGVKYVRHNGGLVRVSNRPVDQKRSERIDNKVSISRKDRRHLLNWSIWEDRIIFKGLRSSPFATPRGATA